MSAWRVAGPSSFARRGRVIARADLQAAKPAPPVADASGWRLLSRAAAWLSPAPFARRRLE